MSAADATPPAVDAGPDAVTAAGTDRSGGASGSASGTAGRVFAARWSLVAVTVLAFVVRARAYAQPRQLLSPRELDDATTYSAAVDLLHGHTLYSDLLYLHPPGLVAALLPFAWIGEHVGDAAALAAARVLTVLVGTLSTFLVAWLLRRRGTVAVVAGAGLYAVWAPVVYAERVVFLEPVLNLCLLLALVVLRLDRPTRRFRDREASPSTISSDAPSTVPSDAPAGRAGRRVALRPTTTAPFLAGALTGLACSFKIWAVVTALVLLVVVLVWRGLRAVGWYVVGGVVVAAVVTLPFALRALGDFWHDVVAVQAGRPPTTMSLGTRLREFSPIARVHASDTTTAIGVVVLVVVTAAVALVLVRGALGWWGDRKGSVPPESAAWALLALALGATVLWAPSFYLHYAAFPAPALVLLAGAGAGVVAGRLRGRRVVRGAVGVVAVAALLWLAMSGATSQLRSTGSRAQLVAWAAQQECVWGLASGVVAADAATRNAENGCPVPADVWGEGLQELDGAPGDRGVPVEQRAAFAAEMRRQLEQVDAVVVPTYATGTWLHGVAEDALEAHFRHVGTAAGFEMWERA